MIDHILIADDDPGILSALSYLLETEGFKVSTCPTPEEAVFLLKKNSYKLLLMDLNYSHDTTSGQEGLQLLKQVKECDEHLPVVVMTAWGSIETAVETMQLGARDFIQKPWDNDRLLSIINNQILRQKAERLTQKLEQENRLLRNELLPKSNTIVAESKAMQVLLQQLQQVAQSDANILLTGENGTGKSLLAQYVHELSPRKSEALISVNMGAISESLFESEMFGHVKGAFTDARDSRIGRFELADKGTLFLDEIGNTPYSQQAKLLRVLEQNQFEKVGASRTQQTDCRLISATNCNLEKSVKAETFRKDLLYRINTITLRIPSLCERTADIMPLADYFLSLYQQKYAKTDIALSGEAKKILESYNWPGNIRELSHVIERAVILSHSDEIGATELGLSSRSNEKIPSNLADTTSTLEALEKAIIFARLEAHNGNSLLTAKSLGLSQSAFYRRLEKYKTDLLT